MQVDNIYIENEVHQIVGLHREASDFEVKGKLREAIHTCSKACERARLLMRQAGDDADEAVMIYMNSIQQLARLYFRVNNFKEGSRVFNEYEELYKRFRSDIY